MNSPQDKLIQKKLSESLCLVIDSQSVSMHYMIHSRPFDVTYFKGIILLKQMAENTVSISYYPLLCFLLSNFQLK